MDEGDFVFFNTTSSAWVLFCIREQEMKETDDG